MNATLRTLPALLLLALGAIPAVAQIPGTTEGADQFGYAVASGDFDDDGFADLAVGVPYEDLVSSGLNRTDAGAVNVVYGTAAGLDDAGAQLWSQNSAGVGDQVESGDRFGTAVAAGDFNGDGYADLAIGAPQEDYGSLADMGQVHVLYGSGIGLTGTGSFFFAASPGTVPGDRYGNALAAGDFDGDGFDDLAMGASNADAGGLTNAGLVLVYFGSAGGVTSAGAQTWHQSSTGVLDVCEGYDSFGASLAAGDFDGDGYDDLAVGVINESVGAASGAGAVNVLYGAAAGLTATGDQFWHQDVTGVLDAAEAYDGFGVALAAGHFDDDAYADLAVGVYGEDVGAIGEAGAVNVLYGTSGVGLSDIGDDFWHQDVTGILDVAESYGSGYGDTYGNAVAAGDFDGDGWDDLAIGVRWEAVGAVNYAGAASVLYGSLRSGLTATSNDLWHQNAAGIPDAVESNDWFGWALAAGDFNGDGYTDLAAGVPLEDVSGFEAAGAVSTIYGSAADLTGVGAEFLYQGAVLARTGSGVASAARGGDAAASALITEASVLALLPPTPNPFRGAATLRFTLPEAARVRLAVYDALGRTVAVLVDGEREAGAHAVGFEASALPAGVYVARLEAAGQALTQRLTLVR
jgi:hypothetical protein